MDVDMSKLIELVRENPELEVKAWVDYEVVGDDTIGRWQGEFGNAHVVEYTEHQIYEFSDYETIVLKDDTESLEEYLLSTTEMNDKEIEDYINKLDWKRAIFVDIDLP